MSAPIHEAGSLIGGLAGAAINAADRLTRSSGSAARKAYDRTGFAAKQRGRRATIRWVRRLTRDWNEFVASQGIDKPLQSDLWRFFRDEYGAFDPKLAELFDRRYRDAIGDTAADEEWEDFQKAFHGGTPSADRAAAAKAATAPAVKTAEPKDARPKTPAAKAETPKAEAPKAPATKPTSTKVHTRPRSPETSEPGLADQEFVTPRHRSDTINFDDYEEAEARNDQIRAARRERGRKQRRESVQVETRALLEAAGSLIAYANAKGRDRASALATIDALAGTYDASADAFLLARKVVAEHITDPTRIREAALALLTEDAPVSKDEIKQAFVTVARALLTNPDVRYATIRLDPESQRFDTFYSQIAGRSTGGHYGRADPLAGLHTHDRFGHAKGAFPNKGAAGKDAPEAEDATKAGAGAGANAGAAFLTSAGLYTLLRKMEVPDHVLDDLVHVVRKDGWAGAVDHTEKLDAHTAKCMLVGLISALTDPER